MKVKELKLKTKDELKQLLAEYGAKLRELNFKLANKQLKNIREVRSVKKTIARILTILKQKELNKNFKESKK